MSKLKYSEELILSSGYTLLGVSRENVETLSIIGFDEQFFDDFEAKLDKATKLANENRELIKQKQFTQKKNKCVKLCHNWGRRLALRMEFEYGLESEEMEIFPSKRLLDASKSEKLMLPLMEILIEIATEHADNLSNWNQTQADIDKGTELMQELQLAEKKQEYYKRHKLELTKIRHSSFNELVRLINNINKAGRHLFAENEQKLVLFKSPWPAKNGSLPEKYNGEVEPNESKTIANDLKEGETINIANTGDTELKFFVGESDQEESDSAITIDVGEEIEFNAEEIGDGTNLKVQNPNNEKAGKYLVEI